jgi:nicotinamidase/pyrazinamidase
LKEEIRISETDALIVVDVQRDFLPGGALPVPRGDEVIPVLNDYISLFESAGARVFATRDWHPPNHVSFKPFGGPWPMHCLQDGEGAKFPPDLKLPKNTIVISKATDPQREAYSGFDGTALEQNLKEAGVTHVFVGGLATDYCVKTTVLDGLKAGFKMTLLLDAVQGINVKQDDSERAVQEAQTAGAAAVTLEDFVEPTEIPAGEPEGEASADKSLVMAAVKKKARLRSRGPYRQTKTEK